MPEETGVEIAHKLAEREEVRLKAHWEETIEIAEAIVLALVAVVTAWSGYEAAVWEGHQALLYGQSARWRVEAGVAAAEGGQQRLLDVVTFNSWIEATDRHRPDLAAIYFERFSPEYRVALDAWLKEKPFTNHKAPPGPSWMPQYHNTLLENAARVNAEATQAFTEGTDARDTAEQFLRGTVLLATVLFLIALGQRFKLRNVRVGILVVSALIVIDALVDLARLPRL